MASKSRRNKVKFKFTKELAILLVCIVAMITATVVMSIPTRAERTLERYNTAISDYNTKSETQYSLLDSENVFEEISFDDFVKKANDTMDEPIYVFYGSLSNGTFLENLSKVNAAAKQNKVEKVYVYLATFIDEAEDKNSIDFKNKIDEMQNKLPAFHTGSEKDALDLNKYPTLLVYDDNKLVFNTQMYEENKEYTWSTFISQAFTCLQK